MVGERGGAGSSDSERRGLADCDREGRRWLGCDRGQRPDSKGGSVARDGAGGVGDVAAKLIATHGERGNDAEGGGGGATVAGAIGQVCPSAGAGGLALPLVKVVTEGCSGATYSHGERCRITGYG